MLNNGVWCFHFCLRACYMYACHLNILVIWWEMCNFINLPCNWSHANYIIFLGFSHTTAHLCKVLSCNTVFRVFYIIAICYNIISHMTMLLINAESIHQYVLIWFKYQIIIKTKSKLTIEGRKLHFPETHSTKN